MDGWRALVYIDGSLGSAPKPVAKVSGSLPELTGLVDALDGPSVIGVYVFLADGEQREAGGPRIVRLEIRTAVSGRGQYHVVEPPVRPSWYREVRTPVVAITATRYSVCTLARR